MQETPVGLYGRAQVAQHAQQCHLFVCKCKPMAIWTFLMKTMQRYGKPCLILHQCCPASSVFHKRIYAWSTRLESRSGLQQALARFSNPVKACSQGRNLYHPMDFLRLTFLNQASGFLKQPSQNPSHQCSRFFLSVNEDVMLVDEVCLGGRTKCITPRLRRAMRD